MNEYYIIERILNCDNLTYKVVKYSQGVKVNEEKVSLIDPSRDLWVSTDPGFQSHKNENANRRIRLAKRFKALGEPINTAFWFEGTVIAQHTSVSVLTS